MQVSAQTPFLGCSPDGLVGDDAIIEVKCPYTARELSISPRTVTYLYIDNGQLKLKSASDYYYQIMGTLYCTGRKSSDLVVYTFKEFKVINIERDDMFISQMVTQLSTFFNVMYFKDAYLSRAYYKDI